MVPHSRRAASVSLALIGLAVAAQPAGASIVISDGTFNDADWILVPRPFGPGGGSGSAMQVLTGGAGDNGPARQTSNTAGPNNSGSYNASIYTAYAYNPSVTGPITGLTISIDAHYINGLSAVGAVVEQAGLVWMIGYGINSPSWQTYTFTQASGDWFLINPGGLVTGPGPDFSATGGSMRFGFYTANASGPSGSGYTDSGLNDNFVVSFVPAPGSAAALGIMGLLSARRRR